MNQISDAEKMAITKYDLYYESRMTRVESSIINLDKSNELMREMIKEIKSDLRWVFGITIGFMGILLGLMAKGFHWFV